MVQAIPAVHQEGQAVEVQKDHHTFIPLIRPTTTNTDATKDGKPYNTFYLSTGIGARNVNECGQADLHTLISNAFSVACQ